MTRLRGVLDVRGTFIRPCIYKVTSLPAPSLPHLLNTYLLTDLPTRRLLKALVGFTDGQLRAWLQGSGEAGDLFAEP